MKGQYHKAVGFVEASEENGNLPRKTEDSIQTNGSAEFNIAHAGDATGTGTTTTRKGEIEQKLNQLMEAWAKQGQLAARRDQTDRIPQGRKDPGVGHPPRNRVKTDWENRDIQSMYKGAGYNTKKGVIHVEAGKGAPPPPRRND